MNTRVRNLFTYVESSVTTLKLGSGWVKKPCKHPVLLGDAPSSYFGSWVLKIRLPFSDPAARLVEYLTCKVSLSTAATETTPLTCACVSVNSWNQGPESSVSGKMNDWYGKGLINSHTTGLWFMHLCAYSSHAYYISSPSFSNGSFI